MFKNILSYCNVKEIIMRYNKFCKKNSTKLHNNFFFYIANKNLRSSSVP